MQVRVLGRVEVRDGDGAPVVIGQWKVRQLVAVLALADGPVPSDRLRSMLWADARNAVSAVTTTLSRLRQVLPDGHLVRERGGYRLVVDPEKDYLDVREFRELVATARAVRAVYPERSADLLRRALELWRDPQLPDLPDAREMAEELRVERGDAVDALVEVQMALGRHAEVAREVPVLLAEDELNDRLWLSLMLALYRDGRKGESLRAFEQARQTYLSELGAEPGAVLRSMRDRIAANDLGLGWHPGQSAQENRAITAGGNLTVASVARMYDFMLGGDDNFEVDRQVARQLHVANPDWPEGARRNRAFLRRVVEFLAGKGIRQFLDLGSGLPTQGNVHEVAREVIPDARVVYVDLDPMVVAHGRATIEDSRNTAYILGDLRTPAEILDHPQTCRLIHPGEPVGVLMLAVLHFLPADEAHLSLEQVRAWMPPGSALAISHGTRDDSSPEALKKTDQMVTRSTAVRVYMRSRTEIENLFTGLDLIAPLDDPGNWQTDQSLPPTTLAGLGSVAFRT
jgi:DNA-binding SARP family transcriptional activator/O-methyltransferase involved in polyketide biosynthesis